MPKKKDWVKSKVQYDGFVYVLRIQLVDSVVHKIGTTNRLPKTRMLEIAGDSEFRSMCVNELKGLFRQCLANDTIAYKSFQVEL